jgi:hypothetical protein
MSKMGIRKSIVVILVVVCVAVVVAYAQKPASSVNAVSLNGRYQIVSSQALFQDAPSSGSSPSPATFLLDSQTGRVWMFQSSASGTTKEGKPFFIPESFAPIDMLKDGGGKGVYPE